MNSIRLKKIKKYNDYESIKNDLCNGLLYEFIIGKIHKQGGYTQSIGDDFTSPGIVFMFLDAFVTEKIVRNEQIQDAFSKIEIHNLLDTYLVLFYIEEYFRHKKDMPDFIVDLNVNLLVEKLKNCKQEYKDDKIVKRAVDRIKVEYGYDIKF